MDENLPIRKQGVLVVFYAARIHRTIHNIFKFFARNVLMGVFASLIFSGSAFAADLTGIWQSIDDKTGSPKALIEITQAENGSFTGKIIKVTPRPGYTPKTMCVNCPAPYTNKPLVGLEQ